VCYGKEKKGIGFPFPLGLILLSFVIALSLPETGQLISHFVSGTGVSSYSDRQNDAASLVTTGFHQLPGRQALHSGSVQVSLTDRPVNAGDNRTQMRLIPGGQSIGIRVATRGVLVVGYHAVSGSAGGQSPGENADIRIGDVITKINGAAIRNVADVQKMVPIASQLKPLKVDVLRRNSIIRKNLIPVKSNGQNQLGLNIRDSASGIGTLTYYDPETSAYGALGHVISDHDTGQPILIKNGSILKASVMAIEKGVQGKPGEKIALFSDHARTIGTVEENTPFGIFGHFQRSPQMSELRLGEALPVARPSQVHEGPAKILTVLNGNQVQAFSIRILNSETQRKPGTKGLVIKITDPRLLKVTGGIIQGMSGSPIIQNGMLVGAVTHVFVNDPTCGYGIHIEWMLRGNELGEGQTSAEKAG
jgi:stage IV sporulation protein B